LRPEVFEYKRTRLPNIYLHDSYPEELPVPKHLDLKSQRSVYDIVILTMKTHMNIRRMMP
jgi:hypothetical protein